MGNLACETRFGSADARLRCEVRNLESEVRDEASAEGSKRENNTGALTMVLPASPLLSPLSLYKKGLGIPSSLATGKKAKDTDEDERRARGRR
jgi:hypothetical protein